MPKPTRIVVIPNSTGEDASGVWKMWSFALQRHPMALMSDARSSSGAVEQECL